MRTKAGQVKRVWGGFFARYPDAASLAKASDREVETALASLGLRWRARKIRELAEELVKEFPAGRSVGGKVLVNLATLGPYSAGATRLLTNGYGDLPVDWGIARVLSRVYGIRARGEIRRARGILEAADALSPCSRELFWALVDLAREICLPHEPNCEECPLASSCAWASEAKRERSAPATQRMG